ncbi:F-box domain-containing protein [Pyricularia oryzae 70-15]|uniref:F-box domain-containing protein n=1 Tax=Pyricularia oryzae (strain 70-15 / ATCC MYA-4617 / FGSC 8958) TaxID=242507 RepID=G4N6F2_PYRO7|nr:F-box domain-containing protein [Pyricularia oryzae 70-15]EHA49822.1 F-box domain-containing protein [Pyricularia oryzae 70-15]KAI7919317.1 F-box domain-containing protein [Pyricularia oryzae]KAI7919772.1 F-box domain-containing protein [Pyricularia oryzae]
MGSNLDMPGSNANEPSSAMARKPEVALAGLPEEILLAILLYLEPADIARLQQASRKFCGLFRDNTFWRSICLQESPFLESYNRRRVGGLYNSSPSPDSLQRIAIQVNHDEDIKSEWQAPVKKERRRIMANWDPTYVGEDVSWYSEYIQRHGKIAINWLQQPQISEGSEMRVNEVKGVALYRPDNPECEPGRAGSVFAVSPLEDGSVCLWDVNGTRRKPGGIAVKSEPGILFIDGPRGNNSLRSKRVDSGVTECVAVDSYRGRAFVAVQSHLLEVDLERMSVAGCESFPWSITTMSTANPDLPLTVGTTHGLHIHDHRARGSAMQRVDDGNGIDQFDRSGANGYYERSMRALFADDPLPPYTPLAQPGPLSILHLGELGGASNDIYVAGRFSNILHYDRRNFGTIKDSIHSGARLCSMTSLPYPYNHLASEGRRKGQMSVAEVKESKELKGHTLVACGEYNTKGSLELYGLRSGASSSSPLLSSETIKNRQTSSPSKLLSVSNHGTRLVVSNGSGLIKWFERDGFTEVRKCRVGQSRAAQGTGPRTLGPVSGCEDMARKLLPIAHKETIKNNEILFWTGERLGLVGFSARSGFTADEFEQEAKSAMELEQERVERGYREGMRLALQRQAEDVRFVRGLGLGAAM